MRIGNYSIHHYNGKLEVLVLDTPKLLQDRLIRVLQLLDLRDQLDAKLVPLLVALGGATVSHPHLAQLAAEARVFLQQLPGELGSALEDRQYLCAGRFTIADIVIAWSLFFANRLGIEEAFTPNIRRWYDHVTDRPAFREATQ